VSPLIGAPAPLSATLPDELAQAITDFAARASDERLVERMWSGDDTVWGPAGQAEVADRLGWLQAIERGRALLPEVNALAESSRARGDRVALLLGMGGSSLAPEVLRGAFGQVAGAPELRVLDSTVPSAVLGAVSGLEGDHTLVLAASKSGGTLEPRSMAELMWEQFGHHGDAFAAITDPGSGLEALAGERHFRQVVAGDAEVGGRYSALTAFGLVPGADPAAPLTPVTVIPPW